MRPRSKRAQEQVSDVHAAAGETAQAKQPRAPALRQALGDPLDMGAGGIADGERTLQQRLRGLRAERRAARRIGPQDARAVGAPQPHGDALAACAASRASPQIDGGEYGLVHEYSRNRRARRTQRRNLQQFLIMRAGRRVHAAGTIGAGQFQLTLTIRSTVRREIRAESANAPVVMLKRAKPFASRRQNRVAFCRRPCRNPIADFGYI